MHVDRLSSISEALAVLLEPNSVVELRAPNAQGRTLSGYFNDRSLFAKAACAISGKAPGVYVTLNPVRADLLARAVIELSGSPRTPPATQTSCRADGSQSTSIRFVRLVSLPQRLNMRRLWNDRGGARIGYLRRDGPCRCTPILVMVGTYYTDSTSQTTLRART